MSAIASPPSAVPASIELADKFLPTDASLRAAVKDADRFYKKAWGQEWKREKNTLRRSEIKGAADNEPDHIAGEWWNNVGDEFEYDVIRGMDQVAEDLSAPYALRADVVILKEYKTLLAALTATTGSLGMERKSAVVTGQPGIGKTTFLLFLLIDRLQQREPTALQLHSRYYLIFDEQGVTANKLDDADNRLKQCWALVDSNSQVVSPCGSFLDKALRVIQTTSPKVERWKEWRKQARAELYVMDLPNVMEIAAIVKEHGLNCSLTFYYASKWGPCSRTIIDVIERIKAGDNVGDIERSLANSATRAAKAICATPAVFEDFMLNSDDRPSSFASLGSSLLFIGPFRDTTEGSRLVRSESVPVVPTKHCFGILISAWNRTRRAKSLEFFDLFSTHSLTRTAAGWMHEFLMHAYISIGDRPLRIYKAGDETVCFIPPSSNFIPGTLGGLDKTLSSASFYWLPDAKNFSGIDGVLGISDAETNSPTTTASGSAQTSPHIDIYALQATIAHVHGSPADDLRALWKHITHLRNKTLHVVVVADQEATATRLTEKFKEDLNDFAVGDEQTKRLPVNVWASVLPTT
ncbi:hypothetical protein PENSPDRAFT_689291 [Peniophora sp. CONT]|nr:hypothetical protein PENSPDRAFT_689291 [Peniophora sp. CONT]